MLRGTRMVFDERLNQPDTSEEYWADFAAVSLSLSRSDYGRPESQSPAISKRPTLDPPPLLSTLRLRSSTRIAGVRFRL
ncbi:hypothetical protein Hdeb2414_s0016g00490201 [Helianthus debilis subsp. tardiflorus]